MILGFLEGAGTFIPPTQATSRSPQLLGLKIYLHILVSAAGYSQCKFYSIIWFLTRVLSNGGSCDGGGGIGDDCFGIGG